MNVEHRTSLRQAQGKLNTERRTDSVNQCESVSKEKKKPQGLRCPKCGCADFRDELGMPAGFVTTHTVPLPGAIRRYKYCRNCGKRIRTKEMIEK